jgi:hypothetical protein
MEIPGQISAEIDIINELIHRRLLQSVILLRDDASVGSRQLQKSKEVEIINFGTIIPRAEHGVSSTGVNPTFRSQTCLFVIISLQGAPAFNSSSKSAHHWAISTRSSQN